MRITKYKLCLDENRKNILIKESATNYGGGDLTTPQEVVKMMNEVFYADSMSEEYVYTLSLNAKCKVNGVFEISHGTINSAPINPREIMIRMLLSGACHFILLHGHPSGECIPSREDKLVTLKVEEAAKLIGIPMIDHIIIGEKGRYFSFKESGILV